MNDIHSEAKQISSSIIKGDSISHPLVSILIPVYNREKYIKETIDSAIRQTYSNIEIIVVDNNSSDDTWNIIVKISENDKRIKIFKNETNIGPVLNWKRCVSEASGVYGKILWSDDLIAPTFIEKTLLGLKDNANVGFVFTGTEIFVDSTGENEYVYDIGKTGTYNSKDYVEGVLFGRGFPVSPGCALFRLSDLEKNLKVDIDNNVNSDFSKHAIGNDLLIFLLTANEYKEFRFINERLSYFRHHNDSITIKAVKGKIPLHYTLAACYFVEHFRKDLVHKMNVNVFYNLMKYPDSKKYGLNKVNDFYTRNANYNYDYAYLCGRLVRAIKGLVGSNIYRAWIAVSKYMTCFVRRWK